MNSYIFRIVFITRILANNRSNYVYMYKTFML